MKPVCAIVIPVVALAIDGRNAATTSIAIRTVNIWPMFCPIGRALLAIEEEVIEGISLKKMS